MGFGLADFSKVENVDRLRVIIMDAMEHYPLKPFKRLKPREQKRFNEKLNDYINNLPELEVDWDLQLQSDFNEVCQREIFTEDFDPNKVDIIQGVYKETEARLDAEDEIRHKEYADKKKKEQEEYLLLKKEEEEITTETAKEYDSDDE
jgi:hypothetical protein